MKRKSKLSDLFFPVEVVAKTELFGKEFSFAKGREQAVFLPEKKKVVNDCSKEYVLTTNEDLFLPVYEQLISRYGEGGLDVQLENMDDRRFFVRFLIKNLCFEAQGGDTVVLSVNVQNSYDGSMKKRFSLGYFRKICRNGLFAFSQIIQEEKKHSSFVMPNMKRLFDSLEMMEERQRVFAGLTERVLSPAELAALVVDVKEKVPRFPKKFLHEVPIRLYKEAEKLSLEPNAFLAYNGFNYVLNHGDMLLQPEMREKVDGQVLKLVEALAG